jgi:hypothetical protein
VLCDNQPAQYLGVREAKKEEGEEGKIRRK